MLMRSSSTPALNSWGPQPSPETEFNPQLIPSCISKPQPMPSISLNYENCSKKMSRNLSESCCMHRSFLINPVEDDEQQEEQEVGPLGVEEGCRVEEVGGGGDWCGGVGGGSGGGDGGCWDASGSMDVYYQSMIEANPGNSMLLSNYAIYLKEIRGDVVKAEEYCGRAILANSNDGNVLSMYGDLIWQNYEDAQRAHIYFDRAVKVAPDNCNVMASYARFLWDAEDEI